MNTTILKNTNIEVRRVTAPLAREAAWQIESLLLKIFEHGDYSFRAALGGEYSKTLNCTFFLTKYKNRTIGAAGCLYAHRNPDISIIGPVCVDEKHRGKGIGTKLVESLIEHLRLQGCLAIYLGVSQDSPAVNFYKKLGFERYKGIVMRRLLCPKTQFEEDYFGKCADTKIRRVVWGDFPSVQVLASFPVGICTFDFRRNIFSSRYVEPFRFLSVFPEMMRGLARYGGFANVLLSGDKETVVGIAHIGKLLGKVQQHIAELDFYVHDNFIEQAQHLVYTTIEESESLSIDRINCYCPACDRRKQKVFESLGAVRVAVLPGNVRINENLVDILVYEIRGQSGIY